MNVIDKLVLLYETQGADKVNKDLDQSRRKSDEAAKAYEDLSKTSDDLKKSIRDLSIEMQDSSGKEKTGISQNILSLRKKLNSTKDAQSVAKQNHIDAKAQFVEQAKTQKNADKMAGVLATKNKRLTDSFVALGAKVGLVAAPMVAFKKILDTTLEFGAEGQALRLSSAFSGADPQRIQLLGNALKAYGGDAASASAMTRNLTLQLEQLRRGESSPLLGAAAFYDFSLSGSGLDGMATAEEILKSIAKKMESLPEQSQLDMARMIGLDAPTTLLLQGGLSSLVADLKSAEKLAIFSDKDLENARLLNEEVINLTANIGKLKAAIAGKTGVITRGFIKDLSDNIGDIAEGNFLKLMLKAQPSGPAYLPAGKRAIRQTRTPLSSMGGSTTNNQSSSGGVNVTIQGMTIQTAATDADGIASDIGASMDNVLSRVLDQRLSGTVA